ncbi:hypothetical protein CAP35_09485 [Chitinophagaceae bacterium IBVUCB1]|nr:hypothetical protein CAP35_09485 [Chitinophagaceae bacterium IBVUCB1]
MHGQITLILCLIILYTSCSYRKHKSQSKYVTIIPYGNISQEITDSLTVAIKRQYGYKTILMSADTLPSAFINKEKGIRYSASNTIDYLKGLKHDTVSFVVGITDADIYITKKDKYSNIKQPANKYKVWGIFGLAYKPGVSCIVSIRRLIHTNRGIMLSRIKKITLHEIGHNHGLHHCQNKTCLMTDAVETISTIDNANEALCNDCMQQISSAF